MVKYFYKEESAYKTGKYVIKLDFTKFDDLYTKGSFNILPARLMGLSYADYCRMCRDLFGAEVVGKNSLYPTVYFKDDENLQIILKILNKKMELILSLRDNRISDEFKEEFSKEYKEVFEEEPDDSFFEKIVEDYEALEENREF